MTLLVSLLLKQVFGVEPVDRAPPTSRHVSAILVTMVDRNEVVGLRVVGVAGIVLLYFVNGREPGSTSKRPFGVTSDAYAPFFQEPAKVLAEGGTPWLALTEFPVSFAASTKADGIESRQHITTPRTFPTGFLPKGSR